MAEVVTQKWTPDNTNSLFGFLGDGLQAAFGFGSAYVQANSNSGAANDAYRGGQMPPMYYPNPSPDNSRQAPQMPQAQAPQNAGLPTWAWVTMGLLFAAAVGFAIYKRRGA